MTEGPQASAYDGLIFDLDGTLWDSTIPVARAWDVAARKANPLHPGISTTDVEGIMGLAHQEIFAKLFPDSSEAQREVIARECYDLEIETLRQDGARLYPDVAVGLKALARRYPLFIVSNCQSDYLKVFLDCVGMRELFRDGECHGGTGLTKAQNLKLLAARNQLKLPCYVGDTEGDQIAADRAGMDFYHVEYGFGSPDHDCMGFASFADLSQFFLSL